MCISWQPFPKFQSFYSLWVYFGKGLYLIDMELTCQALRMFPAIYTILQNLDNSYIHKLLFLGLCPGFFLKLFWWKSSIKWPFVMWSHSCQSFCPLTATCDILVFRSICWPMPGGQWFSVRHWDNAVVNMHRQGNLSLRIPFLLGKWDPASHARVTVLSRTEILWWPSHILGKLDVILDFGLESRIGPDRATNAMIMQTSPPTAGWVGRKDGDPAPTSSDHIDHIMGFDTRNG